MKSNLYINTRNGIEIINHISSVDILHATLSFDSDSVKSVTMSRNSLKTLRDHMVQLYGI